MCAKKETFESLWNLIFSWRMIWSHSLGIFAPVNVRIHSFALIPPWYGWPAKLVPIIEKVFWLLLSQSSLFIANPSMAEDLKGGSGIGENRSSPKILKMLDLILIFSTSWIGVIEAFICSNASWIEANRLLLIK